MLRKSIHFKDPYWNVLQAFMRGKGIDSPSLAIEILLKQLLQRESENDCRSKSAH